MTHDATMIDVLEQFKAEVNSNAHVQRIVRGWTTVMALEDTDTDEGYRLAIRDGRIDSISPGGSSDDCTMRIVGDGATIRAVFAGRLNGIRANNDGLIAVYGPMGDQVKLDAIALILWGM